MTGGPAGEAPDRRRARAATERLGAWVAELAMPQIPGAVRERLSLVLFDTLGVTALGARTAEQGALRASWLGPGTPAGPAPLIGAGRTASTETAAWLNASALVALELDEGNKHAGGHPAAHGFPAVLALAAERGASGADTAAALLAAYEVAARFGAATRLRPGAHPHGSWGVAGAAAGCARLLRLDASATAAAIDTGAGMPVAGHFASATEGNPVRDAWMGAANMSGLAAARAAEAGAARCTGTAAGSLGTLLGHFDADTAAADLGHRWDITRGYLKRHASCSFTHTAADAALALAPGPDTVERVEVQIHGLGAGLAATAWRGRLGALFSIPFVVATALLIGRVGPEAAEPAHRDDPRVRDLAARVHVTAADDLTARLPNERAARVRVELTDGTVLEHAAPNPIGDADHRPLDADDVAALLSDWGVEPAPLRAFARDLPDLDDVGDALRSLSGVPRTDPASRKET